MKIMKLAFIVFTLSLCDRALSNETSGKIAEIWVCSNAVGLGLLFNSSYFGIVLEDGQVFHVVAGAGLSGLFYYSAFLDPTYNDDTDSASIMISEMSQYAYHANKSVSVEYTGAQRSYCNRDIGYRITSLKL